MSGLRRVPLYVAQRRIYIASVAMIFVGLFLWMLAMAWPGSSGLEVIAITVVMFLLALICVYFAQWAQAGVEGYDAFGCIAVYGMLLAGLLGGFLIGAATATAHAMGGV